MPKDNRLPKGIIILHGYQTGNEFYVNANLIGKFMQRKDANGKKYTAIFINGCNRFEEGTMFPSAEVSETPETIADLILGSQTYSL